MNKPFQDDELRSAYQPALRETKSARGPECPEPDALLAALRGEGSEPARLRILDHALGCAACRPELALLHAVSREPAAQPRSARAYTWRRLAPLAAAASITIVAGIFGIEQWRNSLDENVRGGAGEPALIAPASTGAQAGGPVTFVWHRVAGALRYRLDVMAADGTVLFTAPTTDTTLTAQLDAVQPGERRWSVRAHMDDGSERHSETRVLQLR